MDNQQREWLLRALAHTDTEAPEEIACEIVRDQLGLYVEAELYQEDAAQQFPSVSSHLHTCPDCSTAYQILRDTLIDNAFLADTVDSTPPVAHPASPRSSTLAEAIEWAREQLGSWQRMLEGRALVYRSSTTPSVTPVGIPGYEGARVTLTIVTDSEQLSISGVVDASNYPLQGLPLRLYTVTPPPEVRISAAFETTIDDFDTFSFNGLPIGRYVLTIVLPESEVGLTFIGEHADPTL